MPAKSAKQYKLMAGVAHGSIPATGGLTKETAKSFVNETPKSMRSRFMKKKKNVSSNS